MHSKSSNLAIFGARVLKFSPDAPCWLYMKTHWSNNFLYNFCPPFDHCAASKNTILAIFGAKVLKFLPDAPCIFYMKKQWSNQFLHIFCPCFDHCAQPIANCHYWSYTAEIFTRGISQPFLVENGQKFGAYRMYQQN